MKGDFSRSTFDKSKHYSGVLQQQGRVQVDADWNEFVAINAHRRRQLTRDLIGPCGGPIGSAGFAITPGSGNALTIGAGQYYVHGLLVENESDTALTAQPDLPAAAMPTAAGTYLAWLDVWERHLTALDDDHIREVALGGPDTATRSKVVWQVKLTPVEAGNAQPTCASAFANWDTETAPSTGQLAARAQPGEDSDNPCVIKPGAGYRRLENQLYRVEIHDPGADGTATFKWSRDNGTVVTRWIAQSGDELEVASIGRDAVLRFSTGDWVELIDDERDLGGLPGTLVKLVKAEGTVLTIDPATATATTAIANFKTNPKVRRWDMSDGPATVEAAGAGDTWLALEDGVEVQFQSGAYKTGDYWLIPARTATSDVEWPTDETTSKPLSERPMGIHHHYCRLALLGFTGTTWSPIHDCRNLFPPVTQLTALSYLGGDGQEVAPHPTQPTLLRDLPAPLRVGVANGRHPVENARVRFRVTVGNGRLQGNVASREVVTGPDGLAATTWALSGDTPVQKVEAELLDAGGAPVHLPIVFTATLSQAERVSYDPRNCPPLAEAGAITVQQAIDELCRRSGGAEPGMRIKDIIAGGEPLINDTDVPVERISPEGIQIHCDQVVAQESVRDKPVCFLTLELPYPVDGQTRQFWNVNQIFGFQPIVLEANLNSDNNVIFWSPSDGATAMAARQPVSHAEGNAGPDPAGGAIDRQGQLHLVGGEPRAVPRRRRLRPDARRLRPDRTPPAHRRRPARRRPRHVVLAGGTAGRPPAQRRPGGPHHHSGVDRRRPARERFGDPEPAGARWRRHRRARQQQRRTRRRSAIRDRPGGRPQRQLPDPDPAARVGQGGNFRDLGRRRPTRGSHRPDDPVAVRDRWRRRTDMGTRPRARLGRAAPPGGGRFRRAR